MHTYQYSCNYCNHFVETNGPWPYYGKHDETEPIYGLTARIYCPVCDKEKDYIIVKYKTPLDMLDDIWLLSTPKMTRMTCYKCKSPVFLTLPEGSVKCPRCKKDGIFLYIFLMTAFLQKNL
jgi:hypothetical protein